MIVFYKIICLILSLKIMQPLIAKAIVKVGFFCFWADFIPAKIRQISFALWLLVVGVTAFFVAITIADFMVDFVPRLI